MMDELLSPSVQMPTPMARPRQGPAMTVLEPPTAWRDPENESPFFEPIPVRVHTVEGAGGVALRVYDAGDEYGPVLFFVHGFSQCHLAWRRQFQSALGLGFRLVALDLRGHGLSDKPRDSYGDGRVWARDIHAVITALELERPLMVGWSYGAMIVADYLRHFGQGHVAGVHFVSAMVKSGSEEAFGMLSPEMHALVPGLFTEEGGRDTLERFVSLLHHQPVSQETRKRVLAYTEMVPAYVREALGSRSEDYDDVLHGLSVPVLVTHGLEDRMVLPASSRHIASLVPGAQVSLYSGVGHSPFWEDARRFNRELAAFAARCW
jgi:pimeloyl-ACP methyl ester carboxylesterase